MKLINKFLGFGIACGAMFGFAACTNELNEQPNVNGGLGGIRLAKSADITAWSGNQFLSPGTPIGTKSISPNFSTRDGEGEDDYIDASEFDFTKFPNGLYKVDKENADQQWDIDPWKSFPKDWKKYVPSGSTDREYGNNSFVSQNETDYVVEYIKNHIDFAVDEFKSKHFYIQPVGGSRDSYPINNGDDIIGSSQMNQLSIAGNHVNDYNAVDAGARYLCLNWEITDATYQESTGSNTIQNAFKFYYIEYPEGSHNINCYLCFDYRCYKSADGINYDGDGIYNDWIIKLIPVDGMLSIPKGALPPNVIPNPNPDGSDPRGDVVKTDPCPNKDPENPDETGCTHDKDKHDENGVCQDEDCQINPDSPCAPCPKERNPEQGCQHSKGSHDDDGYCSECTGENDPCHKPSSTGGDNGNTGSGDNNGGNDQPGNNTPSTPAKGSPKSEVEVNLSINDEHTMQGLKDLVAKLSIHIRNTEDVEIFIPVGAEHYVANDDLIILKDHQLGNFEHGGEFDDEATLTTQFVTYEINGYSVTLTVQFEPSGIKVTTSGMRKEIFDYLKTEFGDGLNFEVWLYFNDASEDYGRTQLQSDLNRSTIEFLGDSENKYPDYYINAFNHTADNHQGEKDCTVSIVDNQNGLYQGSDKSFPHLNGSSYNKIYWLTGKDLPEGVHDHHFLWDYYNPSTNNSGNQENPAQ